MNRLYVIESTPSSRGAKGDHRLPLRAVDVEWFARALAGALGLDAGVADLTGNMPSLDIGRVHPEAAKHADFLAAVVRDLEAHGGASVVLAGDHQPPLVHALAHAINAKLGNVGKTLFYGDPGDANPVNQAESMQELVADMRGGKVDLLLILGGNPAYDAPADLDFADLLKSNKVSLRVHLGLYQNETADLCHWHINQTHELEAWGVARAYVGMVSIIQPLISPIYQGKSAHEFLPRLSGQADTAACPLS